MAVVVRDGHDAFEMSDSPSGGLSWKGQKFDRTFAVFVDDYNDGTVVVKAAGDLPKITDTYGDEGDPESQLYAICRDVTCKRAGPRQLVWFVTCKYETLERSDKGTTLDQEIAAWNDPLEETPEVSIKFEIYQKPALGAIDPELEEDEEGFNEETLAIVNSAGELFSPRVMRDHTRMIVTISRIEDVADYDQIFSDSIDYGNSIDEDTFWGQPPHSAKMQPFGIERTTRTIGPTGELKVYLKVTYTIHFQWPDWDFRPLDHGGNYLDAATGTTTRPFICRGHPYRGLLDGGGLPLNGVDSQGQAKPIGDTPPVFLDDPPYQIYPALSFGELNLPETILGDIV